MADTLSISRIIRRDGSIVKYSRDRIANAIFKATLSTGNPNRQLADQAARRAEQILLKTYSDDTMPSVEDIQDIVENTLMVSRLTKIAHNYIVYRHQRAQLRAQRSQPFEMSDIVPYKKIYEVLLWNINHRCDSIGSINSLIAEGGFPELVRASESRYHEEITVAIEKLAARLKQVRVVIVAGPSSSGKTTTTIKIGEGLAKLNTRLKTINIDNYFFDLDKHPKDEFGDHDYETPHALDLELINRHLQDLLDGKTIDMPHYDFKSGKQIPNAERFSLAKNEVLLIDSLHGLYKGMTGGIPDACKFRFYIETLGQFRTADGTFMRWADNRLLRRMVRDQHHRNLKPIQTLTHWHYVRTSELTHIIPFINTSDCVINSALPYELPVLKARLFSFFSKAIEKFKDDPGRQDAYIRARRVRELLQPLMKVSDDSVIPRDSLLREFIGNSGYTYH
ncbi:MAG: response regulator SirA [Lentisphaerales bacterium]|jgi:uridine kinase|nr:MAG: response regulator SirA [Lentisphaerales bacterium]